MNMTRIVCAIAAASLSFGGVAFAQGGPNGRDEGRNGAAGRADNGRHANTRAVQRDERHDDRPGAGPDHRFYKGSRLPDEYRGRQYVVDDWRGHHLNAPPRGYHWVQAGGDYVLAAIATGVIASILINGR